MLYLVVMNSPSIHYMALALEEARAAAKRGEVPVGAVLVDGKTGKILAASGNQTETENDPTAHAEMRVIRAAATTAKTPRLPQCDLYVTLEPCAMCATAISFARIRRVYFGAYDPKGGGVEHGPRMFSQPTCHHAPDVVGGLDEKECGDILKKFFEEKR